MHGALLALRTLTRKYEFRDEEVRRHACGWVWVAGRGGAGWQACSVLRYCSAEARRLKPCPHPHPPPTAPPTVAKVEGQGRRNAAAEAGEGRGLVDTAGLARRRSDGGGGGGGVSRGGVGKGHPPTAEPCPIPAPNRPTNQPTKRPCPWQERAPLEALIVNPTFPQLLAILQQLLAAPPSAQVRRYNGMAVYRSAALQCSGGGLPCGPGFARRRGQQEGCNKQQQCSVFSVILACVAGTHIGSLVLPRHVP